MREVVWLMLALVAVTAMAAPVGAQPAAPAEVAPEAEAAPEMPEGVAEQMQLYRDMGMDEEEAMFFAMLGSGEMDTLQMIMLMRMMAEGGGGGDAMGMFMLMNAMNQNKGAATPVVVDRGETLLIVEGGALYAIDVASMEVTKTVPYAKKKAGGMGAMLPWLMFGERIDHVEEEAIVAEVAEAQADLKQLALAVMMYVQDWDMTLPGETWAEDVENYVKDAEVFARGDLAVGYAMNEKLPGAKLNKIPDPVATVLFFESNVGGANPLGGADDMAEEALQDGFIYMAFLDGHVEAVEMERARELLEQDPFE